MALLFSVVAFIVIPLVYVVLYAIPYFWKIFCARRILLKDFPTPPYHWFLGHLKDYPGLTEEGLKWHQKWTERLPRYYLFFVGPIRSSIILNHPETIKRVTSTNEPKQFSGGGAYQYIFPWVGDGILLSKGRKWTRNRKLLTPGFHFDILKSYIGVKNDSVEKLMGKFERESAAKNESIDVFKPVGLCTYEVLLRCAFSSMMDVQNKGNEYVRRVDSLSQAVKERTLKPHLYIDLLYKLSTSGRKFRNNCAVAHKFAADLITQRKLELQGSDTANDIRNKRFVDFLDILLLARDSEGKGFTDQEIMDEVQTFMLAGHDTTKCGIAWLLFNLAKHPEIQAKARAEIDSLLDGRENDRIEWSDLGEMPYTTQCIKESMRTHPPVPFIGRELDNPIEVDGKIMPAGTQIDIMIWNLHHNPTVWKDPWTYDPDRFLPENIVKMDSHAFMPFSAGQRNCIGQHFAMNEMKITAARVLRRFELSVDESKENKPVQDIVLSAEDGVYLFFKTRDF